MSLRRCAIALAGLCLLGSTPTLHAAENSDWGINLWFHSYWTGDGAFIDVSKTMRAMGTYGSPDLTDQGIPFAGGTTNSFLRGYTAGTYTLSYEGSGPISFSGSLFDRVTRRWDGIDGRKYVELSVKQPSGGSSLRLNFGVSSDVNNPIRNVRLTAPGYDHHTTQVYRDEFLRRVGPFSFIRFMDWSQTNDSIVTTWSQQKGPDYFAQPWSSNGGGGVAWKHLATMANESGNDAWINVPHKADDDYIRNLAQTWVDHLDPGRTLYVEYSNEIWNPSFNQYHDLREGAEMLYRDAVAPRLEVINAIFDEVFGDRQDNVKVVLAGQAANDYWVRTAIDHFKNKGVDPADVIDAIAIAPYFNVPNGATFDTFDELMESLMDHSTEKTWIQKHAVVADQHGLDLLMYEGGVNSDLRSSVSEEWKQWAQTDPRLAEAYRLFDEVWREAGGDTASQYTLSSWGSRWGLLQSLRDKGSIKWDALMDILLDKGDATLDDAVNFADFEVLRNNFLTNGWWEQGDFNADRFIDAQDLDLLYGNLSGLTDEQWAIVDEFRATAHAPEPTTLTLLGAAALVVLRRRG